MGWFFFWEKLLLGYINGEKVNDVLENTQKRKFMLKKIALGSDHAKHSLQ